MRKTDPFPLNRTRTRTRTIARAWAWARNGLNTGGVLLAGCEESNRVDLQNHQNLQNLQNLQSADGELSWSWFYGSDHLDQNQPVCGPERRVFSSSVSLTNWLSSVSTATTMGCQTRLLREEEEEEEDPPEGWRADCTFSSVWGRGIWTNRFWSEHLDQNCLFGSQLSGKAGNLSSRLRFMILSKRLENINQ